MPSIPDVLDAVEAGEVDLGFVPIENSIEGTVNVTLDTLAFETDLLIQREVVLARHLDLLARPGSTLDRRHTVVVVSPHATAQCRVPGPRAAAGRDRGRELDRRGGPHARPRARRPRRRHRARPGGRLYGLEVLAADIEDHAGNQTRFVLVAREGIPAATGHDKTSIVVFQRADEPGWLLAILQEFAARGDQPHQARVAPHQAAASATTASSSTCEGHLADEVVADALRASRPSRPT